MFQLVMVGDVILDRFIDDCTGIILIPSPHGNDCPGNGRRPGLECCCDACDFYLICFPDWASWSEAGYQEIATSLYDSY